MADGMDFAGIGANIGRQLMAAGGAQEAGFTKMAQLLAKANKDQAQGDYYASKTSNERQRAQYQTPEHASRIGAAAAGLTDPQATEMDGFIKNGNWGMNPATEDPVQQMTLAPAPKATPGWATPEATAKYNAGRMAQMLNLGATGDSKADDLQKAMDGILARGDYDASKTSPEALLKYAQSQYAQKGGAPFSQDGTGVISVLDGGFAAKPEWQAVQKSAVGENNAQAANAYASAGSHNANAAKTRMEMAPGQSTEGFTPGAIDAAAARYNMDGTLPPMGMGKEGALGRRTILNRAAELAGLSNISPDDQRINQIGNKANTAALSKIQQQQTMVGAFEKNFNKNADIALEFSQKVDRTGVPLLNKWILAGKRAGTNDPDLAAFDQAIKSASNEYAKIISGSMGNTAVAEGEIRSMESKLNAAQTPEAVSGVINMMRRETQNRMTAFEDEKAQLRGTMKPGGGNATAAKPSNVSPAEKTQALSDAKAAIAAGAPRAAVIQRLKEMGISEGAI